MINILDGKNIKTIDSLDDYLLNYENVVIDLGTGNGKYLYEKAILDHSSFFIGIDPITDNIIEYQKKKRKHLKNHNINNVLFVVSSIEDITNDLYGIGNKIYVNFPWGSLLEGVVKGNKSILTNISNLLKSDGQVDFVFTYSSIYEEGEIKKRGLPKLSLNYFDKDLRNLFKIGGLNIDDFGYLAENSLKSIGTLWAKKIYLTKERIVFYIKANKI